MHKDVVLLGLKMAKEAFDAKETPVGAVIFNTKTSEILCCAHNEVILQNDPTAHAEVLAVRKAGQLLGSPNLTGYSIFATVEPCAMCATAISWGQLDKVFFGAYDTKSGAIEHGVRVYESPTCHHKPDVIGGIHEKECADLMSAFFKKIRTIKNDK